jgi:2-methylisocitrate lyase-like PEP mutase family enzyme
MARPTTILKTILNRRKAVILAGAANSLFARIIEDLGYEAVYVTGAGVANMYLGAPDIGLTTLTEIASHVSAIADAVELPLLVDADTGFGNPVNMVRTVNVLERAGAAGLQIEDQVRGERVPEGVHGQPREPRVAETGVVDSVLQPAPGNVPRMPISDRSAQTWCRPDEHLRQ